MNIFVPYEDAKANAQILDDKRLVKMVLETAQILSTVLSKKNISVPYKPTHKKHPCIIWAGQTRNNYTYTVLLGKELSYEYTYRYNRKHKSQDVIEWAGKFTKTFELSEQTPFANCTPYSHLPVHVAYQATLLDKWREDANPKRHGKIIMAEDLTSHFMKNFKVKQR